jgi:hypothetical protein
MYAILPKLIVIYINMFLDTVLIKCILKNFVVLNELVVELCHPFHLCQIEGSWINRVHNLAVDGSCCALLNLRQLKLLQTKIWVRTHNQSYALTSNSSFIHSRMMPFETKKAPSIIPIESPDIFFINFKLLMN